MTKQGKSQKAKGKRKKRENGHKPLNLFMEQNKNIYFEMHSTRNNMSVVISPQFIYGDYLFTFYFLLFTF
ncbi:MAG: hypothetical protein KME28_17655 [Pelatocladus maniniholoensis HA4357-MV3]|jgi:hypothetical protein|uniref:Uncharacterized protein n=1 Tax=Pelatocladus maniniholoensis HA4357-MV3 TaxID=1117104 RepID=A0A9E3HB73_9NOST|nr:hypothetical protein [Pelatocladus maniniholoensis HA4357-MV3]